MEGRGQCDAESVWNKDRWAGLCRDVGVEESTGAGVGSTRLGGLFTAERKKRQSNQRRQAGRGNTSASRCAMGTVKARYVSSDTAPGDGVPAALLESFPTD